jgi:outer membrane usher protein
MFTSLAYEHARGARGLEASAGLTVMFGGRTGITSAVSRKAKGSLASVDLQRSLPAAAGVGYQLHGEAGSHDGLSGSLQLQSDYGRYEIRRDALLAGHASTRVHASGGVAAIGGHLFATRAIYNSFALVEVPGVDGVRAYSSNQEVGRTAGGGRLLIPNLLPYYANAVQIADADVPLDFVVPVSQFLLAPPYRGGAVVRFPVQRLRRVVGAVTVDTLNPTGDLSFGEIAVVIDGARVTSPVGRDGEFYFEDLPAGEHQATVTRGTNSCTAVLTIAASDRALVNLGRVPCSASTEASK